LLLLFGFTIIFFALETLLISVLNGLKEIKKFTVVKILGSIIGLIFTGGLSYFFGLKGALIALTINQAVLFFVSVLFVIKSPWFNKEYFFQKIEFLHIRNLLNFTFMAFLFGILTPIVQIAIRDYIVNNGNITLAGYWDGLNKLSTNYLTVITTTISVYFLPKYSKLTEKYAIKKEMIRGIKIIIPSLAAGFVLIYLFRFLVIDILYSKEFYPMESLFLPRLLSDLLQMVSWIVSYIMLAKAMVKKMIVTQVVFSALTYLMSVWGFDLFGLEGVMWGNVIRYILYCLLMFYMFRDILWSKRETAQNL
jgi:PST family polysaccharide transporter